MTDPASVTSEVDPAAERLLDECLRIVDREGVSAISAFCDEHPEHAEYLRQRINDLNERGLLDPPAPDFTIDTYEIERLIGAGAMGEVYNAWQLEPLRRRVALKVVKKGLDTRRVIKRFEIERQLLSSLDHAGIAKVFDAGSTTEGRPYFAMQLVDGIPVTRFCAEHRLGLGARLDLFVSICRAVQYAHQNGVLHRDLKPSNILVSGTGNEPHAYVIDFGLAKAVEATRGADSFATDSGAVVGTLRYMSPEQASHSPHVDTRTDVYALGVVLFEFLLDEAPFNDRFATLEDLAVQMREREPPRLRDRARKLNDREHWSRMGFASPAELARRLRGDLEWITAMALQSDPNRRYASAGELAADLERHIGHRPVLAGPPSLGYVIGKFVRRRRTAMLVTAVTLVALVATAVSLFFLQRDAMNRRVTEALDANARLQDLIRRETEDPISPRSLRLADMRAWIADVETALRVGESLRDLHAELDAGERGTGREELARATIRREIAVFDENRSRLDGDDGLLAWARRRLAWAEELAGRDGAPESSQWHEAAERLKQDPRFRGLDLQPLPGLAPLGPDEDSGLEEFALLVDGASVPERDDDGALRVDANTCPVLVLVPIRRDKAPLLVSKYELTRGQWRLMSGRPTLDFRERVKAAEGIDLDMRHPIMEVTGADAVHAIRAWGLDLPRDPEWWALLRLGLGKPEEILEAARETLSGHANVAGEEAVGVCESSVLWRDNFRFTCPVDAMKPDDLGLHQLVGNLWEIVYFKGGIRIAGGSWHCAIRISSSISWNGSPTRAIGVRPVLVLESEWKNE